MDINFLLSFKNLNECQFLEKDVISSILEMSKSSSLKYRQRKKKSANSILKNKNMQNKKEEVVNLTNLYLNKLTSDNIDIILSEFVKKFGEISKEDYDIILKSLFVKILYEINFIDVYLNFMKLLISVYYKKLNLEPKYFFNLIEKKIEYDYLNKKENELFFKKFENENYRKSNLILIKKLVEKDFIDLKLLSFVKSILLNQNKIVDIYVWFKDNKLTSSEQKKLENISNTDINFRSKVLINSLLNLESDININNNVVVSYEDIVEKVKVVRNVNINQDIESKNIYEEYFLLQDDNEVGEYIINECSSANKKNNFCKVGIDIFSSGESEIKSKILKLYSNLIKKKSLYKSNLSRGLMLFVKRSKNVDKNSIKLFLQFLASKGITNGIEYMFKKYKINL
jgi:hypothetical protein